MGSAASHILNKSAILQSVSHTKHSNYFLTFYLDLCNKLFSPNLGKTCTDLDWDCRICPYASLLNKERLQPESSLGDIKIVSWHRFQLKQTWSPGCFIGFIWFSWKQKYMGGFPKPQSNMNTILPQPSSTTTEEKTFLFKLNLLTFLSTSHFEVICGKILQAY